MDKLKEILLRELTPLIPFGFTSGRIGKYWITERDPEYPGCPRFTLGLWRRLATNVLSSVVIPIGISVYLLSALSVGANPLNPRDYLQKRHEYRQSHDYDPWQSHDHKYVQRVSQEEGLREKDIRINQFHRLDKNDDNVLNLDEYCDYELNRGGNN